MFMKELVISGIRKQHNLISEWIGELERKPGVDSNDSAFFEARANRIVSNLRELRKIKEQYINALESIAFLD